MTVTRRSFLRSGAMAVVLTGLALEAAPLSYAQQLQEINASQDFQIPFEAKQESTFYFKRETFEPYLNGLFKLSAGRNAVEGTLTSVRDCTPSTKSKLTTKARPTECFALVFRTQATLTDLTTIYDVEHGALGKFRLFLTRRDGGRGAYYYEAVFNHVL